MRTDSSLESKIQEYLTNPNSSYRDFAKYLLEYKGDYNCLKIIEICNILHISSAIPTRMAQELGLQGFSELKMTLQNEKQAFDMSIKHYDNLSLDYYVQDIATSLQNSFKLFSQEKIDNIVTQLNKANRVYLFAVGGSYLSSLDFGYKLMRIGINAFFEDDRHVQYFQAQNTKPNDIAIGISYSGRTKEVIKALELAKANGTYTILITSNLKIPKEQYDEVIYIFHDEMSNRVFSITSRTTIISILDIIYINLLNSNHDKYYKILRDTKFTEY